MSKCIKKCALDENKVCKGCKRTIKEIIKEGEKQPRVEYVVNSPVCETGKLGANPSSRTKSS